MAEEVTEAQVRALLAGEAKSVTSSQMNKAYACCKSVFNLRRTSGGAYRDPLCRAQFDTAHALFRHGLKLLARQRGRCAISGIRLRGRDGEKWFKMSLDAIDPRLGHVPGNLRWVCMFLNSPNSDKLKRRDDVDDVASAWDPQSFRAYVGIDDRTRRRRREADRLVAREP